MIKAKRELWLRLRQSLRRRVGMFIQRLWEVGSLSGRVIGVDRKVRKAYAALYGF